MKMQPCHFDPTNIKDMADKIGRVWEDHKLVEALRQKGQKQVQKYSWKRMGEQTLDVYKSY